MDTTNIEIAKSIIIDSVEYVKKERRIVFLLRYCR